jgi:trehalose/maltose hydrolase-like predicted phosphorylase
MTGDISLAAQQYFAVSRNTTWLRDDGGFALIEGIARFWASKAQRNPSDGTWSIAQTQSPDEYHTNITDGVFPNEVAKQSLYGAYALAHMAGAEPNETFRTVADGLRILYCAADGGADCDGASPDQRDFHPAFVNGRSGATFNSSCVPELGSVDGQCQVLQDGGKIKQGDVVLIYYPLAVTTNASTKKHDLDLYSQLTDIDGPAMTWMIHSIAYGDLGEDATAARYFTKSWAGLVRSPFFVWHEGYNEFGGAPNFINAAGMFLVNVAAGYGGVRWNLTDGSLRLQRPRPPPNCSRLVLRRVFYRGALLNIEARADGWAVGLAEPAPQGVVLELRATGAVAVRLTVETVERPVGSSATIVQLP